MTTNIQPKKKRPKQTQLKRFVDKALVRSSLNNPDSGALECNVYFDEIYEMASNEEIIAVEKKMTEKSVYNAIKSNKAFKKITDTIMRNITEALIEKVSEEVDNIQYDKEENERDEQFRKENEAANKELAEKTKREKAERLIFNECLTPAQKKSLKKFYGIDVKK